MTSQEQEMVTRVADAIAKGIAKNLSPNDIACAAIEAMAPLVEQAFKDGLTYGNNVRDANPELAWQHSRVRAALSKGEK